MDVGKLSNQLFTSNSINNNKEIPSSNASLNKLNNDTFLKNSNPVSFCGKESMVKFEATKLAKLIENDIFQAMSYTEKNPAKSIDTIIEFLKGTKEREHLQSNAIDVLNYIDRDHFYTKQGKLKELLSENVLVKETKKSIENLVNGLKVFDNAEYEFFINNNLLNNQNLNIFVIEKPTKACDFLIKVLKDDKLDIDMKTDFCGLFKLIPKPILMEKKAAIEKAINSNIEFASKNDVEKLKNLTINSETFKITPDDFKRLSPVLYKEINSLNIDNVMPTRQLVIDSIKGKDPKTFENLINKAKSDDKFLNELCDLAQDKTEQGDIKTAAFDVIKDAGKLNKLTDRKK